MTRETFFKILLNIYDVNSVPDSGPGLVIHLLTIVFTPNT